MIGVINAGARTAVAATRNKRIGIIATETTINSGVYTHVIEEISPGISVVGKACPLFVPLVEEDFSQGPYHRAQIASRYLEGLKKRAN